MSKLPISIIQAISDPNLFKPLFKDLKTWASWVVFLKALFALPMDEAELDLYRQCTGRTLPPERPFVEAWVPCGRRSGKTFTAALIAVFLACFRDYTPFLSAGERGVVCVIASDRAQAGVLFRYIKGFLAAVPMLKAMVENEKNESIDLNNRITVSVMTCSYKAVRGFTVVAALLDEAAHWRDDSGRNPASEVVRALRPAMGTIPGAPMIAISSPYARSGILFDNFNRHHGKDDSDVLCWKAETKKMNPTFSQATIDREMLLDPENARAEYYADFRSDVADYLSDDAINAITRLGRFELPPMPNITYTAFVDVSGGRSDSSTLAIGHTENKKVILDIAHQWKAPHIPAVVIEEQAGILRRYGISVVIGDRYGGAYPEQEYLKHGLTYQPSEKNKSEIYLDFLPLVLSGSIELLDNKTLFNELRSLERRTRSGGHDSIDHPAGPRFHDDLANAVAGVCVKLGIVWEPGFIGYLRNELAERNREIEEEKKPVVPVDQSKYPVNTCSTPRGKLKQGPYDWPMPQGGSSASETMRAFNEAFSKFKNGG